MIDVGWLTNGSEESEVLTQNGSSPGALFARRGHNREGQGEVKSGREETQDVQELPVGKATGLLPPNVMEDDQEAAEDDRVGGD